MYLEVSGIEMRDEGSKLKSFRSAFSKLTHIALYGTCIKWHERKLSSERGRKRIEWCNFELYLGIKKTLNSNFQNKLSDTYIVSPDNFVGGRIRFDYAFKVAVVSFLNIIGIQAGP